jgi:hypothetical protein
MAFDALRHQAHNMTRSDVAGLLGKLRSIQQKAVAARETTEKLTGEALSLVETVGSAFACGYVAGRTDGVAVLGVPFEAWVGVVGHGAAAFGAFGRYAEHAHSVSNGALAALATRYGVEMGAKGRAGAATGSAPLLGAKSKISGELPYPPTHVLGDEAGASGSILAAAEQALKEAH